MEGVFIADYIKKKRRRKGKTEYLVKWKDYSTRHCTWEPEVNILDKSLIRQFEEEGYDPRRIRACARRKKRRRSEVTESRPTANLFLNEPDTDSEGETVPRHRPRDLFGSTNEKIASISLSKRGDVWRRESEADVGADNAWPVNDLQRATEQKTRAGELADIKKDELSPISTISALKQTTGIDITSLHKNGGKGCHPKMRAKFMFRSGDMETCGWGYDWSSSDNESVKALSPISHESHSLSDIVECPKMEVQSRTCIESPSRPPLYRTYSDISEASDECGDAFILEKSYDITPLTSPDDGFSFAFYTCYNNKQTDAVASVTTIETNDIPFPEDMETAVPCEKVAFECEVYDDVCMVTNDNNNNDCDNDSGFSNSCSDVESIEPIPSKICTPFYDEVMFDHAPDVVTSPTCSGSDVAVTEVTCDDVTVIFHESRKAKGFFEWNY
ncbi:hypothetical protein DPMN_032575 [Dreissena polymorpha]|uniref:Chromo domain-containing protein n=2 Tax=Dreissena polymorpha TaxID=45954 RepID=A0A9D4M410_DREPO|nr:hypothetical protein DPMN_032575 [Dreissena polymorpha]